MNTRHALLTALFITACTAPIDDVDDVDDRVINGQPVTGSIEHTATVGLQYRSSGNRFGTSPGCSGTLIASDVVLTAAHCLVERKGFKLTATPPNDVRVYFGDDPFVGGESVPVSQTWVHPNYSPSSLDNDIAMLRLANPASITPVAPLPSSMALTQADADAGLMLDFVGFGYSDLAKTQIGRKLHNDLPYGGPGCAAPGCSGGAPTDTQFWYFQYDTSEPGDPVEGPCNGDSGGPAFTVVGTTPFVAGITSYGDAQCDDYGVSTTVSAYTDNVIADFVNQAPPPDCSADGQCNAECSDDPDCGTTDPTSCEPNGVCDAGESCDGRSGTLSCAADCDGKTNGKPSNRYCYVSGACEGPGCP